MRYRFSFFLFLVASIGMANPAAYVQYASGQTHTGHIGPQEAFGFDNPADNLFHITLPETLCGDEEVWLVYEVNGLADAASIARAVNDQYAVGGYWARRKEGWQEVREKIHVKWLKAGDNIVRFTSAGEQWGYQVRLVRLEVAEASENPRGIWAEAQWLATEGKTYLRGFVQGYQGTEAELLVDGEKQGSYQGEFEMLIATESQRPVQVEARYPDGETYCLEIQSEALAFYESVGHWDLAAHTVRKEAVRGHSISLSLGQAQLQVPANALGKNLSLRINSLREKDLPPLDQGMVNVTKEVGGYRFLPHGTVFEENVQIKLGFDACKIPEGYTEKDVRTYYFDENSHHWVALPLDSVWTEEEAVLSFSNHFTDMINAIIKVPESPEVAAYNSTSMKGIKAANPTAAVNLINPPQANNTGSAGLSYPLVLPAGRGGMQPQLAISYNSGGGNGWLGLGWNLSLPSISIDTRWGVPRYHATLETETYLLNGEQLSPVAHRGEFVARSAEKQFYPRVEGSFQTIIRHGDSPANYWWEVKDKSGTVYSYGGRGESLEPSAVLKDNQGNIAYWALTEVRDLNENFVRYHYTTQEDPGVEGASLMGRQLYIDHITYTGSKQTEGKYSVHFIRDRQLGEARRVDVSIAANLGFKMVTADLLRRVEVRMATTGTSQEDIRSYELYYSEGVFAKNRLDSLSDFDAEGKKFTTHRFEYYDEVAEGFLKPSTEISAGGGDLKANINKVISEDLYNDRVSALGGNLSTDLSGGVAVSFGIWDNKIAKKTMTAGGNVNGGKSTTRGHVSFIDMNGDGLPDKVVVRNEEIWVALQNKNGEFATEKPITGGPSNFFYEESKTISGGLQATGPDLRIVASANVGLGRTTSTTTTYFTEVNGDQLIDLVHNGRTYFSVYDPDNQEIRFTTNSDETVSPVQGGAPISEGLFNVDSIRLELEADKLRYPLHDVVVVWRAPFDGEIAVEAPVQLVENPSCTSSTQADGVRVSVQLKEDELWHTFLDPNNQQQANPSGLSQLSVEKGDLLFFRVGSVDNGLCDLVEWNPVIHYLGDSSLFDANGKDAFHYTRSHDYVLANNQWVSSPIKARVDLGGTFTKGITTDDVLVEILSANGLDTTVLESRLYAWDSLVTEAIFKETSLESNQAIQFKVSTNSQIDWKNGVSWQPKLVVLESLDPEYPHVLDTAGQPLIHFDVVPYYTYFNHFHQVESAWEAWDGTDSLKVSPSFTVSDTAYDGYITYTIKSRDSLIYKKEYEIDRGRILGTSAIGLSLNNRDSILYFSFSSADNRIEEIFENAVSTVSFGDKDSTVNTGVYYAQPDDFLFGPMYRQWGAFSYNGNEGRADQPIKLNLLQLSEKFKAVDEDYTPPSSGEDLEASGGYNPAEDYFVLHYANGQEGLWQGFDDFTYVTETTISSSRFGEDELTEPTFGDTSLRGVNKITRSVNFYVGGGISQPNTGGFSAGGSLSYTRGFNKVLSDFLDLNGDRYPDIVSEEKIQYSLPIGGLGANLSNPFETTHRTTFDAGGVSLSGSYVNSDAKGTSYSPRSNRVSVGNAKVGGGVSGNYANGSNRTEFTWLDVNGDGLADRVEKDGGVYLNLGYTFSEKENWNFQHIQRGRSDSYSAGLGIDIGAGSISAGVGVSLSDNFTKESLQDINGDGLPDILLNDDGQFWVSINTGNGFESPILWTTGIDPGRNNSLGISGNIAFTVSIFIPTNFKLSINPNVSYGQSMSREIAKFTDLNGDGYPDYLSSDSYDKLSVRTSTIGRTNMLKTVHRPLGASFTLNYERVGNTYDMPNNVWALSEVRVFDGHTGDGIDTLATSFTYEDGYYDRHERDFYGFRTIKTQSLDAAKGYAAYTQTVQTFANGHYYEKGLLLNETMSDAAGNKYVEKINVFDFVDPTTQQAASQELLKSDAGRVFPALKRTEQYFYEGQSEPGKSTSTQYTYNSRGDVETYTDAGDEGEADDLIATIQYYEFPAIHLYNSPKSIVVEGVDRTYRRREAVVDETTGNVKEIRQYLDGETFAQYNMDYDEYGNLKEITRPANAKEERLKVSYQYDEQVHSYVTKVSNSYGYSSEATYDFRFGQVLTSTDLNGQVITYQLDDLGRVSTITGPYERATGNGFTLKFDYHPNAATPWALTEHYDAQQRGNNLVTAIFTDGLGRVLQTKKDAALFKSDNSLDDEQMIVSGKVEYDGLGRAVAAYYPVLAAANTPGTFITDYDQTVKPTTTAYDVLSRAIEVILPDDALTKTAYGFGTDRSGRKQFLTQTTDANSIVTEQFTDVRGRVTAVKNNTAAGPVWTSFAYNAINEQVAATNDLGHTTHSEYDGLGRRTKRVHPDAGTTTYDYDLAGNLTRLQTANLAKEGLFIEYEYELERLMEIRYPQNPENNLRYTYGASGAEYNRAGRIVVQEDASGAQEFFYGPLGEVVKNIRTVVIPQHEDQTYTTEWTYDTWNRLTSMIYPDGEELSFTYNTGGLLHSMSGTKKGRKYSYVKQLGYDKFEQRVFLAYGNGTKTTYTYEEDRRRLKHMNAKTGANRVFMDNTYEYDKVNNILGLKNTAPVPGSPFMGGASEYSYSYDELYRLKEASGSYTGANDSHSYTLAMQYNTVGGITQKTQEHLRKGEVQKKTSYALGYAYGTEQPNAPIQIGEQVFTYDANGNQTAWEDQLSGQRRELLWDEENRIRAIFDNGQANHYIYDASGERVIKGKSTGQTLYVNGEKKGASGNMGNYTIYVNPYVVLQSGSYTKHYYIEGQRIVSKLGGGWDHNPQGQGKAGENSVNYSQKQEELREAIVKNLKFLGLDGQILTAGKSGKIPPGQVKGTGNGAENFQYYYHPDHLGSTSYITDITGEVYQHLEYFAFGETFVEEHSNTNRTPYKFNGKELDEETGLYYYGARYYDARTSVWLSVDPLATKYPGWSPYNYVLNNPVRLVDPNGLYPTPLLTFHPKLGLYGGFKFTKSAAHLLSLVSGVDRVMIENVTIQKRAPGQYRPFYSADKGGGAITLGTSSYDANITYTENWFEDDASKYEGHGFGQDVKIWLDLSAHEVGHLPQIDRAGGLLSYVGEFIKQYADEGNHDGAPNEVEADKGQDTFRSFNNFVDKKHGKNTLINIMEANTDDDGFKGTESYKIKQINKLWKEYQKSIEDD